MKDKLRRFMLGIGIVFVFYYIVAGTRFSWKNDCLTQTQLFYKHSHHVIMWDSEDYCAEVKK